MDEYVMFVLLNITFISTTYCCYVQLRRIMNHHFDHLLVVIYVCQIHSVWWSLKNVSITKFKSDEQSKLPFLPLFYKIKIGMNFPLHISGFPLWWPRNSNAWKLLISFDSASICCHTAIFRFLTFAHFRFSIWNSLTF